MNQALAIRVRQHRGHVLITVAGEIDIATAPRLRDRLAPLAAGGRPVIADLAEVTFIDAAGLGVLAGAAGKAAASGGSLHVVTARHQVRRAFAVTGLDRTIPLARTRAEALASLHADRDAGPAGTPARVGSSRPPARRALAGTARHMPDAASSSRNTSILLSRGAGKNHAMNTASVSTLLNTARRTG